MSPLHLEIAIWYGTRDHKAGDVRGMMPSEFPPAVREYVNEMVAAGLLEYDPTGETGAFYKATTGLRFYLDMICKVPFPIKVSVWQLPKGDN